MLNTHHLNRYLKLIEAYRHQTIEGYRERHHITPVCLGGGNEASNLIDLPARAHYIAHVMLAKAYPGNHDLLLAVMMFIGKRAGRFRRNSRTYATLKEAFASYMRINNPMKDPEVAKRVADKIRGRPGNRKFTAEGMERIVAARIGSKNHYFNRPAWRSNKLTPSSKAVWKQADSLFTSWSMNPCGASALARRFDISTVSKPLLNMFDKFKSGWIPNQDSDWLAFAREAG